MTFQSNSSLDTKNKSNSKKDEELEASSMEETANSEIDTQAHSTPLKRKKSTTDCTG